MDANRQKEILEIMQKTNPNSLKDLQKLIPAMQESMNFMYQEYQKLELKISELEAAAGAPDLRSAIDERAAFEKWAMSPEQDDFCLDWTGNDPFDHGHTMDAWKAWQARAALASAAPVEALTDEEVIDLVKENLNRNTTGECHYWGGLGMMMLFARAIEARIKGGMK